MTRFMCFKHRGGDCVGTCRTKKAVVEGLLFISGDEGIYLEQIAGVLELEKGEVQLLFTAAAGGLSEN
ncbi:hypothetical protein GCM10020331_042730 [Ectobacillus funiculus]